MDVLRSLTMVLSLICLMVSTALATKQAAPVPAVVDSKTTSGTSSSDSPSSTSVASNVQTSGAASTTSKTKPSDKKKHNPLDSIKTFDLSFTVREPPSPVHDTCSSIDVCKAMNGICNNGTCTAAKCSGEIRCVCFPGHTGPFCDTETPVNKTNENGQSMHKNGTGGVGNGASGSKEHGQTGKTDNKVSVDGKHLIKGKGTARKDIVESASHRNINAKIETQTTATLIHIPLPEQKANKVESTTSSAGITSTPPDTAGYVKGPEVYVATDSSVVQVKSSRTEILIDKPTVISQISDSVPLSTVSLKDTRVGVPHESLAALEAKTMPTGEGSSKAAIETAKKSTTLSNNKLDGNSGVSNKNHNVVSKSEIMQGKDTILTEITGTVEHSKSTIETSKILAVSDIKISIEPDKSSQTVGEKLTSNRNDVPSAKHISVVSKTPAKEPDQSLPGLNERKLTIPKEVDNASASTNKAVPKSETNKNSNQKEKTKQETFPDPDSLLAAAKVLVSSDIIASASQHTEMRKSMQPSVLNPLLKFLSMIGSPTFVDQVSQVKIEIITKHNDTSVGKGDSAVPSNKGDTGSAKDTKSKSVDAVTQTDMPVVDKPVNINEKPGTP